MKIKEFLDRSQVQIVTGLAPQILREENRARKRSSGETGTGSCSCRVSPEVRCLAEGAQGYRKRPGQWVVDWEGPSSPQNLGSKQSRATFQVSLPIPKGQGHPYSFSVRTSGTSPLGCSVSLGAASWGWQWPQCELGTALKHPTLSPLSPSREAGRRGAPPPPCLGVPGKVNSDSGQRCGPSAVTAMGDPHGEEPHAWAPEFPHRRDLPARAYLLADSELR